MAVSKINSNNQVIIPKQICNYFHLRVGDKLEFIIKDDNTILLWPKNLKVSDVTGILKPKNPIHLTVEEMQQAVYK